MLLTWGSIASVPAWLEIGDVQLALNYQSTRSNDRLLLLSSVGVLNDNDVVAPLLIHLLELLLKRLPRDVADRRQHPQTFQEAGVKVARLQGPQLVAFRQLSRHLGRDELRREETLFGCHGNFDGWMRHRDSRNVGVGCWVWWRTNGDKG